MIDTSDARFEPTAVAALVFDIGGVFLYPDYQRVQEAVEALGLDTSEGATLFRRAHHAGCRALADQVARSATVAAEHKPDFWIAYDEAYSEAIGAAQNLDDLRHTIRPSWDWAHVDNVTSFKRLAARFPVAVVSNNDGTAPQQMIDCGVGQVGAGPLTSLLAVVDSTTIGVAKPDPAIMAPALDAIGAPPEQVLYVGDTVHADVVGATNAGMQVIQLDPFDHHADYGHARTRDLASLGQLLDL